MTIRLKIKVPLVKKQGYWLSFNLYQNQLLEAIVTIIQIEKQMLYLSCENIIQTIAISAKSESVLTSLCSFVTFGYRFAKPKALNTNYLHDMSL